MDSTTDIPEGIVDIKSYKIWVAMMKHPILKDENKMYEMSDGNKISLGHLPHVLKQRISHLPAEEQATILEKKMDYFKVLNKANNYKKLMYGGKTTKQAVESGTTTILSFKMEEVKDLFGKFFSASEVTKIINETWGFPIGLGAVEHFRVKFAADIEKRREKYKASYTDSRLFQKRSRLDELLYLYENRKQKYKQTESREDYKLLLGTLEQIRKESEGDRLMVEGRIDINVEQNIRMHVRQEVMKNISIQELVLGRVAARMGKSYAVLVQSLNNSYYAKFDDKSEMAMSSYPSAQNYDFAMIESVNRDRPSEDTPEVFEAVVVDDKAHDMKQSFLSKLREKQTALKNLNAIMNGNVENRK